MLLPRNAGPPFEGGLDPAQAGGVLDELQSGAHGVGGGAVATHVERDNRAEALELASRGRVSWVAREAGIARQSDVWMSREALGQCHRVALRTLQTTRTLGNKWVVQGGLSPGERVIVAGVQKVQPGASVRAVEAGEAAQAPASTVTATATARN